MSETNGTGVVSPPLQTIHATEIILANGIKAWCYPIPARDRSKLILQWNEENPLPDKKQYERPVPVDEATIEGQMLSAESNPAWQEMLVARKNNLNDYLVHSYLVGYVEFPDNTENELIARFARVMKGKRKVLNLPDDEWEATLRGAIIDNLEDEAKLVLAIEKRIEISFEEVVEDVAIFRPVDKRNPHRGLPDGQGDALRAEAQVGLQQD